MILGISYVGREIFWLKLWATEHLFVELPSQVKLELGSKLHLVPWNTNNFVLTLHPEIPLYNVI